jgi:hypothetical protein
MAGEPLLLMLERHRQTKSPVSPWSLPVFGVTAAAAACFAASLRPVSYHAFHTPFPESIDPRPVQTSYLKCRDTSNPFIRKMADRAKRNNWPPDDHQFRPLSHGDLSCRIVSGHYDSNGIWTRFSFFFSINYRYVPIISQRSTMTP